MAKYIKVAGLDPDYTAIFYEINDTALTDLLSEVYQHSRDGGEVDGLEIEIVEMKPSKFRKIEEV